MAMMQQLKDMFRKRNTVRGHGPLDGDDRYKALQALGHDPSCALLLALNRQSRQKVRSVTKILHLMVRNMLLQTGAAINVDMHGAEEPAISVAAGVPLQVVIKSWPREPSLDTTELQAELLCLFRHALHAGKQQSSCRYPAPIRVCGTTASYHPCIPVLSPLYPFTSFVFVTQMPAFL